MDVREKLVELIAQKVCDTWSESCDQWLPHDCGKCYANDCQISEIADHLISNGVTVQEWISVKEPPKERGEYLCYLKYEPESSDVIRQNTYYGSGRWMAEPGRLTHWMPLPGLPKEGDENG